MKIYEFSVSRSLRAVWALKEYGLNYERKTVNLMKGEHRQGWFRDLNPMMKVPVLDDNGTIVTESGAILTYLAHSHPQHEMSPQSKDEWGSFYRWMFFAQSELERPLGLIGEHTMVLPEKKRNSEVVRFCREDFYRYLNVVENHLKNRNTFLDRFSCVDIMATHLLNWSSSYDLITGQFYHCKRYLESMKSRKLYKEAREEVNKF